MRIDPQVHENRAKAIVERTQEIASLVKGGYKGEAAYEKAFNLSEGSTNISLSENDYQYLSHDLVQSAASNNTLTYKVPNEIQLSTSPVSIDVTTIQILEMLIAKQGSSQEREFSLSKAMPFKSVTGLDVIVDRIAPAAGVLPEHDYGEPYPELRQRDRESFSYRGARWAGKKTFRAFEQIYLRKAGVSKLDERGIQQILAWEAIDNQVKAFTTIKLKIDSTLCNNGFDWRGESYGSNIPTSAKYTFSAPLGTLYSATGIIRANSACNPLQELADMFAGWQPILRYLNAEMELIINGNIWNAIRNNPNTLAYDASFRFLNNPEQTNNKLISFRLTNMPNLKITVDNQQYMPEGADGKPLDQTQYIKSNIGFININTSSLGNSTVGAFHLTPALENGGYRDPQSGVGTQIFDRQPITPYAPELWLATYINGGPAVYIPEACFTIDFNLQAA